MLSALLMVFDCLKRVAEPYQIGERIRVFIRKRLQWPTVVSIAAGFLAIAGAAFGQTMRSVASEQTTRIATQSSDYQPSGGKLQTSAINLPSAGESASADKANLPES